MQALIDFDGWRKWKDFSQQNAEIEANKKAAKAKAKEMKKRGSLAGSAKVNEEASEAQAVAAT